MKGLSESTQVSTGLRCKYCGAKFFRTTSALGSHQWEARPSRRNEERRHSRRLADAIPSRIRGRFPGWRGWRPDNTVGAERPNVHARSSSYRLLYEYLQGCNRCNPGLDWCGDEGCLAQPGWAEGRTCAAHHGNQKHSIVALEVVPLLDHQVSSGAHHARVLP